MKNTEPETPVSTVENVESKKSILQSQVAAIYVSRKDLAPGAKILVHQKLLDLLHVTEMPNQEMRHGILLYFLCGIPGGGFQTALFSHDLIDTAYQADWINGKCLTDWIKWMHWYMPACVHGSRSIVKNWCSIQQQDREKLLGLQSVLYEPTRFSLLADMVDDMVELSIPYHE